MEMRALRGAAAQGSQVVRQRGRTKIWENARMQNLRVALLTLTTTSTALMVAVNPGLRAYGYRGGTMHSAGAVAVPMSVALSEPPRKAAAALSHVAGQIKPGNQKSLKLVLSIIVEHASTFGGVLAVPAECQPLRGPAACSAAVLQAWGTDATRVLQLGMPGLSDVLLQLSIQGRGRGAGELLDGVHAAQEAACRWNDQALWYLSRVPRAARPRCWAANRVFGYDERNSTACGVLARSVSAGDTYFDLILRSTEGGRSDFGAFDECNGFDADGLADTVALVGGEEVLLACAGDALARGAVDGGAVDGADVQLARAGPERKLMKLTCPSLKELLVARKLKRTGNKAALIERLLQCAAAFPTVPCPSAAMPLFAPLPRPPQPGSLSRSFRYDVQQFGEEEEEGDGEEQPLADASDTCRVSEVLTSQLVLRATGLTHGLSLISTSVLRIHIATPFGSAHPVGGRACEGLRDAAETVEVRVGRAVQLDSPPDAFFLGGGTQNALAGGVDSLLCRVSVTPAVGGAAIIYQGVKIKEIKADDGRSCIGSMVTQTLRGVPLELPGVVAARVHYTDRYTVALRVGPDAALVLTQPGLGMARTTALEPPAKRRARTNQARLKPPQPPDASATEVLVRSAAGLGAAGAHVSVHIGEQVRWLEYPTPPLTPYPSTLTPTPNQVHDNSIASISLKARAACLHGRPTSTNYQEEDVAPSPGFVCEPSRDPLCPKPMRLERDDVGADGKPISYAADKVRTVIFTDGHDLGYALDYDDVPRADPNYHLVLSDDDDDRGLECDLVVLGTPLTPDQRAAVLAGQTLSLSQPVLGSAIPTLLGAVHFARSLGE